MQPEDERDSQGQAGVALLVTIMTMLLLSVLAAAIVLLTSTEALIASSYRTGREAFYVAEAAGEWSFSELARMKDDWTSVASGLRVSTFVDGPPTGTRAMGSDLVVDLTTIAAANPGWRLFAHGPFGNLAGTPTAARFYIVALVTPDPLSLDGFAVRAIALGPRGASRAVELHLRRTPRGVHAVSWAERP